LVKVEELVAHLTRKLDLLTDGKELAFLAFSKEPLVTVFVPELDPLNPFVMPTEVVEHVPLTLNVRLLRWIV